MPPGTWPGGAGNQSPGSAQPGDPKRTGSTGTDVGQATMGPTTGRGARPAGYASQGLARLTRPPSAVDDQLLLGRFKDAATKAVIQSMVPIVAACAARPSA